MLNTVAVRCGGSISLHEEWVMRLIRIWLFIAITAFGSAVRADEDASLARVNINTADAATLARVLDGVGDTRAQAIVTYRETYGAFEEANDLTEVRGIGTRVLEQNRDRIEVEN
jgi:competence protein ComEA